MQLGMILILVEVIRVCTLTSFTTVPAAKQPRGLGEARLDACWNDN
jgi:hypothetical protein